MGLTFTQHQIDQTVSYLMTGGPNGGELTPDQYFYELWFDRNDPTFKATWYSDFILQIQLAINQNHAGIAASKNICRDSYGALNDAVNSPCCGLGPTIIPKGSYANGAYQVPLSNIYPGPARNQVIARARIDKRIVFVQPPSRRFACNAVASAVRTDR